MSNCNKISFFSCRLNQYLNSRNLFRVYDTVRRQKLLKYGRLPVVSFISEMPQTRHFPDTFTMDIALATVSYYNEWFKSYDGDSYIKYYTK